MTTMFINYQKIFPKGVFPTPFLASLHVFVSINSMAMSLVTYLWGRKILFEHFL